MPKIFSSTLGRYFFIGLIAPLLIQYVVFYRFTPTYMINVFSKEKFSDFYGQSVFRYRVVSKNLQLFVFEKLKSVKNVERIFPNSIYKKRISFLDDKGDELFYMSYFIVHLLFAILLSLTLLLLFDCKPFYDLSMQQKTYLPVLILSFAGFCQFVLTPYDMISYFMLALTFMATLKYIRFNSIGWLLVLCITLIASTLNKESVVLNLSAFAALLFSANGFSADFLKKLAAPFIVFLLSYLALRFSLPGSSDFTQGLKLDANFRLEPSSSIGLLFTIFILYIFGTITGDILNRKLLKYFLLFSLPFLISIPLVGIMIEFRLWVPVFIMIVLLSQINVTEIINLVKSKDKVSIN